MLLLKLYLFKRCFDFGLLVALSPEIALCKKLNETINDAFQCLAGFAKANEVDPAGRCVFNSSDAKAVSDGSRVGSA